MTDPTPIVPPEEAARRAAQAFWRHILPMNAQTWAEEEFEEYLDKVEKALKAHPDLILSRKSRLARITTNYLKDIRPGYADRQLAILGQMARQGWPVDAQDVVGLADQLFPPPLDEVKTRTDIFECFLGDLARAGQTPDPKRVVMVFEAPDSPFSPTLLISLSLLGLDVMDKGGAIDVLITADTFRADWAVAVVTAADPLDHALAQYFNRESEQLAVVMKNRIDTDPRLISALEVFDQLKKEKPLFTLADMTRVVSTDPRPLTLVDMLALAGRAGEVLDVARWHNNTEDLAKVVALFEERLEKLPVDKVALLAAIRREEFMAVPKPKVKFKP